MDDKFKNLGFRDFVNVDYTQENDDLIAYQAKKRHRGVVGESMDPRDFTDKPGYLVVVSKPTGKKMIKQYAPTSQAAQKYADRINKTNKVGHKATVHKTDGRKIMKEEVEQVDEYRSSSIDRARNRVNRAKTGQQTVGDRVHNALHKVKSKFTSKKPVKQTGLYHAIKKNEEVEQVDEVISRTERLKRGQRMKRMSKRIQMAKKRALRRAPSMDVLQKRARKQAKSQMIQKWTRGQSKSDLSIGRRADLEKRLKKMGPRLDLMVKKMLPDLRKQDRERRSGSKDKK